MKILFGKRASSKRRANPDARPTLRLSSEGIDKFQGFSYSVEEGQRLSRRSYTELPEFKK